MNKKISSITIAIICFVVFISVAGASLLRSQFLAEGLADRVSEIATESLGNQIQIGQVALESPGSVGVKNIVVHDKSGDEIATVDYANVEFSLYSLISYNPLDGIDQINVSGVKAQIIKRDDGSFNFEDFVSEEPSDKNYYGKIHVQDAEVLLNFDNQELLLEKLQADLDFANYPSIRIIGSGVNQGAQVDITGNVGGDKTTVTVDANNISLENYLRYIPEGTIPDYVTDIKGNVDTVQATYVGIGQDRYFTGKLELSQGQAVILDKKVENINALLMLNERDALVFMNASCAGQMATAHGRAFINTSVPMLDMIVETQDFDPGKIFDDVEYSGGVKMTAHITGPVDNPSVDGEVFIPVGNVVGYDFQNLSAKVHYAKNRVYADDIKIDLFGGNVQGQAEFNSADLSYVAHVKANRVNLAALQDRIPSLGGIATGDIAFEGMGDDFDTMKVYGSFEAQYFSYGALGANVADSVHASFAKQGDNIDIDFFSAQMSGGGIIGLEGNMVLGESMDLAFYGDNINLSQFNQINPSLGLGGRLSVDATIKGPFNNPIIRADVSAHDGQLGYQKFDVMYGHLAGGLRGIRINDFVMEQGENTKWYISGQIGSKKTIEEESEGVFGKVSPEDIGMNIRVDTVGARMEDLVKVVDPEIPITGNVDNVITIEGTLANPHITGFINYTVGSYDGTFIKSIAGDYTLENGTITVQDMNIAAPWFDADLNGIISDVMGEKNLKLYVETHDIDLERVGEKLQYPVVGHAVFEGVLTGTAAHPVFDLVFNADDLVMNGQQVYNAGGHIIYKDNMVMFDRVGLDDTDAIDFDQYDLSGSLNLNSFDMNLTMSVEKADADALLRIFQVGNDLVKGEINGKLLLNGNIRNIKNTLSSSDIPLVQMMQNGLLDDITARMKYEITEGDIVGYPLRNAKVEADMVNSKVNIVEISGMEGETGKFIASGVIDLKDAIQATVDISDIDVGMITKALKIEGEGQGKINGHGTVGGRLDNPEAQLLLDVDSPGMAGVTLSSIIADLQLSNNIIKINQIKGTKDVVFADSITTYYGTVEGAVPIDALSSDESVSNGKNMNVLISLEEADLSVLPGLSPHIEWAVGELDGSVRITGNRLNPGMNGSITIHGITAGNGGTADGAAIKIKDLVEPIQDISSVVTFTSNIITMDHFSGTLGGGSYNAKGYAVVDGNGLKDYSLDFVADKLGIYCDFFNGPVDAEIHVVKATGERLWNLIKDEEAKKEAARLEADGAEEPAKESTEEDGVTSDVTSEVAEIQKEEQERLKKLNDRRKEAMANWKIPDMPLVSGRVFLEDCMISIPSLSSSDDPLPNFFFNFHLDLGKDVRFYVPQMANMELAGGAHLFGSTNHPNSSGSIYCKKGTVSYLKTTFKLREAALKFDQVNSLMPSVKVFADTKISRTRVFLLMNGPLYGDTKLRLVSDPPMNEADIIKFLTLRTSYKPGSDNDVEAATSMASVALQMALLGQVEESMRNSLGLDLFTIERDTIDGSTSTDGSKGQEHEIYNVVLGKNLSEKTLIKGSKSVNSNDYRLSYEYSFDDRFSISVSQDRKRGTMFGAEAMFSF